MRYKTILALCVALTAAWSAGDDWPQWGGCAARHMASSEKRLPAEFNPRAWKQDSATVEPGVNIKWRAPLGMQMFGSPVVAQGRVFVGSNARGRPEDDNRTSSPQAGWFQCLDEQTGKLRWELVIPRLPEREAPHSDTGYGVCSSATVEGDRVYIVTNRGEVLCLDIEGLANGNDGPFKDEGQYLAARDPQSGRDLPPLEVKPTDGDIVWLYNMITELKVHPHDASSCSVLIHGDWLYICTGNGMDRSDKKTAEPLSPSLVVLDKKTGRLVAKDDEKIGTRLFKGQWSSPSLCELEGRSLIVYGGGDGFCYAFKPIAEPPKEEPAILEKVWAVDCMPPAYRTRDEKPVEYNKKSREGPSEIIGTPACNAGRVYVTIGRDPVYGKGAGSLTCIDADKGVKLWSYDELGRSLSTIAVADGLAYAAEIFGAVHCVDAVTGQHYWTHKTSGQIWGSALVADGKVHVGTQRSFLVLAGGKEEKLLATVALGSTCYATPCAANGVLFVPSHKYLYAICEGEPPKR